VKLGEGGKRGIESETRRERVRKVERMREKKIERVR